MQRSPLVVFTALLTTLVALNIASAESTAEDHIKYRQALMESMAGHIEVLSYMAFNKIEKNEFYQSHADALASATAELEFLFPEGSGQGETEALPAIWENPDDFNTARLNAEQAFAALRDAVASGDSKAVVGAFAAAGKSCKGCHEDYREEHEH